MLLQGQFTQIPAKLPSRSDVSLRWSILFAILIIMHMTVSHASAGESGMAVGGKAGTIGFGVEASYNIVDDYLNVRSGLGIYTVVRNITNDDIEYNGTIRLGGVPVILDVFPLRNTFKLSGGFFVNLNRVTATAIQEKADSKDEYIGLGSNKYRWDEIEELNCIINYRRFAPYFGIGLGNPANTNKVVTFELDVGILFQGESSVIIRSPKEVLIPSLKSDLELESRQLANKADNFGILPVVQIGVGYHF